MFIQAAVLTISAKDNVNIHLYLLSFEMLGVDGLGM
jgi:hypothetical protein